MNSLTKKIISIAAAILILGVAYYGNYLPHKKSAAFISALRKVSAIKSLEEFEKEFSSVFDIPSPIGQEELVRNLAGMAIGIVQNNGQNPELVSRIIQYVEGYFDPFISEERGMSFTQDLYVLGNLNQAAFMVTREPNYLEKAKDYYENGFRLGAKRPQFLYGLFDVYRLMGDAPKAKLIGEQILAQWPDDAAVRFALTQL